MGKEQEHRPLIRTRFNRKPRAKMDPSSLEDFIDMLDEAAEREAEPIIRRLEIWRRESERKDVFFGGPGCGICHPTEASEVAKDMKRFSRESKGYDPMPNKKLILGLQTSPSLGRDS